MSKRVLLTISSFIAGLIALLVWIFESDKNSATASKPDQHLLIAVMVVCWGIFVLLICNLIYRKIKYDRSHNSPLE